MSRSDLSELAAWYPDAVASYEDAAADAEHARSEWVKADRPLVQEHKNGTSGQHPLWLGLVQADGVLARRRAELGLAPKRRPGRPVGSVPDQLPARPVTMSDERWAEFCRRAKEKQAQR